MQATAWMKAWRAAARRKGHEGIAAFVEKRLPRFNSR
jgi:hypothetical protein